MNHATICGMRERISTTVDTRRLNDARRRFGERDSEMFDAALAALLNQMDRDAERLALASFPYEADKDLHLSGAPVFSDETETPPSRVIALAKRRRAERRSSVERVAE
jgi:hypothetical protein